ncbi:MAG: ORF6N domain-containing protein [Pontiellaceae bacterium]|nr:ORF6N domain-containing protein [Pontiellaceae bacterium]
MSLILVDDIQKHIYTVRGVQVMFDEKLAELYGVETRVLNQAVKRNSQRFSAEFMFQLTETVLEQAEMTTNELTEARQASTR